MVCGVYKMGLWSLFNILCCLRYLIYYYYIVYLVDCKFKNKNF